MEIKQPVKEDKAELDLMHTLFHETKNPLQVIMSAACLIKRGCPIEERILLCDMIIKNVEDLNCALNQYAASTRQLN